MWLGLLSLEQQRANKPHFYCENFKTGLNTDNASFTGEDSYSRACTLVEDVV